MRNKKIYIFDLDHTLFKARDFRLDLLELLGEEEKISEKI
jgi:phosphoserine phosphatase